jgi:hypothetical protein
MRTATLSAIRMIEVIMLTSLSKIPGRLVRRLPDKASSGLAEARQRIQSSGRFWLM